MRVPRLKSGVLRANLRACLRDYISFLPRGAFVVVYDDKEHVFVLPLLTMTGLMPASGG